MTYYQLNTYKHPPNTHFANVKYLYHKQTFKNWCSPVIKVKVIKVIKHFSLALFSYNIILKLFNIILYIYSVPPETLNDLNDLDLNDRGTPVFECLFVV